MARYVFPVVAGGGGDVSGGGNSTDNAIARWDGTAGDTLQDSAVTIADTTGYLNVTSVGQIGIGSALTTNYWGAEVPGLILDGTAAAASSAFGSGLILNATGNDADLVIATAETTGTDPSSWIQIFTGQAAGAANTGGVDIRSGATSNSSGAINLTTGASSASGSGAINLTTGNSVGISGVIKLQVGTGSARGKIQFQNGTEGTAGHVWTSTDTSGSGEWAAVSAGANTTLSNLGTTSINADLLPSTSGTRDLGSASLRWDSVYAKNFRVYSTSGTNRQQIFADFTSPSGSTTNVVMYSAGNEQVWMTQSQLTSASSKALNIETGNVVNGTSGNIVLRTGVPSGSGSYGSIQLKDGTEGTAGHVWKSTGTGGQGNWEYPNIKMAILREEQTTSTNGGTFTSGAWRTRTLNTEDDPHGIVTLSSNEFTLGAGKYIVMWKAPAVQVNNHQSRLYNVTDAAEEQAGASAVCGASESVDNYSTGQAYINIASSKAFKIEHQCSTTKTNIGLGNPAGYTAEIYTQVEIIQIGE